VKKLKWYIEMYILYYKCMRIVVEFPLNVLVYL
jgi:hypothetical protein